MDWNKIDLHSIFADRRKICTRIHLEITGVCIESEAGKSIGAYVLYTNYTPNAAKKRRKNESKTKNYTRTHNQIAFRIAEMPLCFAFPFMPMCAPNTHVECILKWMFCWPNRRFFLNFCMTWRKCCAIRACRGKKAAKNELLCRWSKKNISISLLFDMLLFSRLISNSNCFFLSSNAISTIGQSQSIENRPLELITNRCHSGANCIGQMTQSRVHVTHFILVFCFSSLLSSSGHFVTEFFSFSRINYKIFNTDWIVNFWIELIRSYSSNLIGIFFTAIKSIQFYAFHSMHGGDFNSMETVELDYEILSDRLDRREKRCAMWLCDQWKATHAVFRNSSSFDAYGDIFVTFSFSPSFSVRSTESEDWFSARIWYTYTAYCPRLQLISKWHFFPSFSLGERNVAIERKICFVVLVPREPHAAFKFFVQWMVSATTAAAAAAATTTVNVLKRLYECCACVHSLLCHFDLVSYEITCEWWNIVSVSCRSVERAYV